jgi:hypothetical protein
MVLTKKHSQVSQAGVEVGTSLQMCLEPCFDDTIGFLML